MSQFEKALGEKFRSIADIKINAVYLLHDDAPLSKRRPNEVQHAMRDGGQWVRVPQHFGTRCGLEG